MEAWSAPIVPLRLTTVPVGLTVIETVDPLIFPLTPPIPEHGVLTSITPPVTSPPFCKRNPDCDFGLSLALFGCKLICQLPEIDAEVDGIFLLPPQALMNNGNAIANANQKVTLRCIYSNLSRSGSQPS